MPPLLFPFMSCGQPHERSLFAVDALPCTSLVLLAAPFPFPAPPLSRCECDVLSRVLSRRWLLLPRLFVGVIAAGDPLTGPAAICCDGMAVDCCCPCFLLLTELELLLSSEPAVPFCSALTISCFASDVFVPGFVRLIFIFSPLSRVA